MAIRTRIHPVVVRLLICAAALFVVLLAPTPSGPTSPTAPLRMPVESGWLPAPSPVRLALAGLLVASVLLELAGRSRRWR